MGYNNASDRPNRKRDCCLSAVWWLACMLPNGLALAQEAGPIDLNQASSLDEVVVTARRREENLQTVPVSVSVLSETAIQQADITSLSELEYYVPSLNIQAQANDYNYPPISIRGQGTYSPGATPAVITYLNEVPVPGTANAGDLTGARYYDLENVQVLKGPQGTLFGRNTTGGALLLQTKRPTDSFEGYVEGTLGNYQQRDLDFALNLPIVDHTVLLRVAGERLGRDGFATVQATPEHPNGLDMGNRDVWSGRVTLTVKPVDGVQNDFIYEKHTQHTHGFPLSLAAVNPDGAAQAAFPQLTSLLSQQQALGTTTLLPIDVEPYTALHSWSITDSFQWDVNSTVRFRNIASYGSTTFAFQQDIDATVLPLFDFPTAPLTPSVTHQITEEPQIQGTALSGRLTWVVGAFYLDDSAPGFSGSTSVLFDQPTLSPVKIGQGSHALYAQDTLDLSAWVPDLKFTSGFRYTWDRRSLSTINDAGVVAKTPDAHFSAPSWTLGLDYALSPATLLYLTSRHGYRSGGFNSTANEASLETFGPESVTDAETGIKADWSIHDVKIRSNLAAYYDWYNSIQLTKLVVLPSGTNAVTSNAGSAHIWGAEFDGQVHLPGGISFWTTGSYFHEQFTSLGAGVDPHVATYFPKYVPAWQLDWGARYQAPLDRKHGELSVSANWSWLSSVSTSIDLVPEPFDTIPAHGILNLNADWAHVGGTGASVSIYVTNATDKHYLSGSLALYDANVGLGYTLAGYGLPRMYGVRLRYDF